MPSQEEYLDSLLNDVNKLYDTEVKNTISDNNEPFEQDLGLLSEEDIEAMLKAASGESSEEVASKADVDIESEDSANVSEKSNEDELMSILSASEDAGLQEIHDMLNKADKNEAISSDIEALLENNSDNDEVFDQYADDDTQDESNTTAVNAKKKDKSVKRSEKKAKKEAAKQAKTEKKRLKAEQKALNKASKKASKEKTAEMLINDAENDLTDMDALLDSVGEEIPSSDSIENIENFKPLEAPIETVDLDKLQSIEDWDDIQPLNDISDVEDIEPSGIDLGLENTIYFDDIDDIDELIKEKEPKRKKGLFTRIIDALTEEEEESDEKKSLQLSNENIEILDDLDSDIKEKKGRKNKKSKKDKKNKISTEPSSDDDEMSEDNGKKKKKAKKVKKLKKEKILKVVEYEERGKKLSFKKMLPVFAVCISLAVVLILAINLTGNFMVKKAARDAFYEENYEVCYQNLYGKDLSETEQIMFGKSESILRIRLWWREYELLEEEGSKAKALDSLVQSVYAYPTLYEYSEKWKAQSEVGEVYSQIINALSEKYNLTEEQAMEIAQTKNDIDYSRKIYTIVNGGNFGDWDKPFVLEQEENEEETVIDDVLPEEEDIKDTIFIDNN